MFGFFVFAVLAAGVFVLLFVVVFDGFSAPSVPGLVFALAVSGFATGFCGRCLCGQVPHFGPGRRAGRISVFLRFALFVLLFVDVGLLAIAVVGSSVFVFIDFAIAFATSGARALREG